MEIPPIWQMQNTPGCANASPLPSLPRPFPLMRWFYLTAQQEQIPTSESKLVSLAQQGALRPQTLVWHEGQADWQSLGELKPELFTDHTAPRSAGLGTSLTAANPHRITQNLVERSGWILAAGLLLQIFGLLLVVATVLYSMNAYKEWHQVAASLEGAKPARPLSRIIAVATGQGISALALIWMGSLLITATARLRHGQSTGESERSEAGLLALGKFFVLLVIGLSIIAVIGGLIVFLPSLME